MKQYSLTEGSISKGLLSFFIPILLGAFLQYFYNLADAVIVGQYVGKVGLAAVGGSTGVIISLLIALFTGISSGATVVIAQRCGAHDDKGIKKSIHTAAAMTLIIGALLTIIGIIFIPMILRLLHTPPDVLKEALVYLRIYFCGISGMVVYNFGSSFLRAFGDSRRPTYILLFCCVLSVALDLLFVGAFRMGVGGAALSTILSQFISALYIIHCLLHLPDHQKLILREIGIDRETFKAIIQIGLPAGFQAIAFSVSNLLLQASINRFGTNIIAAFSSYEKVEALYLMMIEAFGVAITTFAGQNFGAGKYDRLKKGVKICTILCFSFTIIVSGLLLLFNRHIIGLFTHDAEIIDLSSSILNCIVPLYFTCILISIIPGVLRSVGDNIKPFFITCAGICVFRVAFVYVGLNFMYDIRIINYSYPISWGITSIAFLIYYKSGNWLK